MPSRLASDRPIKNVIGSVDQILLQRRGGLAGGWVCGQQRLRWEGWPDDRSSAEGEKRERARPSCARCLEALSRAYRGVRLLCFVVCLLLGQGRDDLSLFVGISGSAMWL